MAKIFELDEVGYAAWVASRPECVRKLCERFPPDRLYLLKSSKHRVTILAYSEDDTLRVWVGGQYNFVTFEREVFGVKPDDMEECELPPEGEVFGTMLTEDVDVEEFIDAIRPSVLAARDADQTSGEQK